MIDYISIGSSPTDEDCAQVGSENYLSRAMEECRRFVELLRKKFGDEPEEARLRVKSFPHDFGTYSEVVCYYDDTIKESLEYAFFLEENVPQTWD